MRWQIPRQLNGIGEVGVLAWEEVTIEVKLGELDDLEHQFFVVEDEQMPFCFLLVIEFLRKHAGNECLMKGNRVVVTM